jgi:hypothetical protein
MAMQLEGKCQFEVEGITAAGFVVAGQFQGEAGSSVNLLTDHLPGQIAGKPMLLEEVGITIGWYWLSGRLPQMGNKMGMPPRTDSSGLANRSASK